MRIRPTQSSFAPDGAPPAFRIETGGHRYFAVQVATNAFLLNGAAASRRTQANFFDSWLGDDHATARGGHTGAREVAGEALEAPTGSTTYALPVAVWKRLEPVGQLYYRLIVSSGAGFRRTSASTADVDWARAPSVSIARLPARPAGSVAGSFPGKGSLARDDFVVQARRQIGECGMIQGRDGDFRFAVMDATCYQMTVVEAHEFGLTDTVDKMPRKPDAIINAQFFDWDKPGIHTEGQVIREGAVINSSSQATRYYVAQIEQSTNVGGYHVGEGNPDAQEPDARVAFGGLGPILLGGAPITHLTPFAKSVYDMPAKIGRGAIAIHRGQGLILLLVQQNSSRWSTNSMTMPDLRKRLLAMGFDDAVFNDGSDSESLYAGSGWLLKPGFLKDEGMDFALGFVDRHKNRRFTTLSIDGTVSADGQAFAEGVARPVTTHFAPRNIADDLAGLPALSPVANTFASGIIQAWQADTQNKTDLIGRVIQLGGLGGHWADLLYISSHAWRHGQLWYHKGGGDSGPILMLADLWSPGFRPVWHNTPRWLIIAGCAVLGLRYSRGLKLDNAETGHLVDWHHDMHGAGANVPGLNPQKKVLFAIYHPGWAWYKRVFQSSGLRGVLGYWYRSPGKGRDVDIIKDFTKELGEGQSFLGAWEAANKRGWLDASAAWAAMVCDGCQDDTLATLEDPALPAVTADFKYYDRFQTGPNLTTAYQFANRLNESTTVGSVAIQYNDDYDKVPFYSSGKLAIDELNDISPSPTSANFLAYDDGIGQ